jgi:hypothetical protein
MAAQHYAVWTILDYSDESSPLKVFNGAVTSTSIAGYITDLGSFRTLTQNLVLGTVSKEQWVGDNTIISQARPSDPDAQRERKGLVVYKGNTTNKLFTLTIPTIRTKASGGASLIVPGTDLFDLAASPVAPWIAGFESLARTPDDDTETVTVQEIRLVGRNI